MAVPDLSTLEKIYDEIEADIMNDDAVETVLRKYGMTDAEIKETRDTRLDSGEILFGACWQVSRGEFKKPLDSAVPKPADPVDPGVDPAADPAANPI